MYLPPLNEQRSGQLVLAAPQLVKWRSPGCSECVSIKCSIKTPESECSVTGSLNIPLPQLHHADRRTHKATL